MIEPISINSNLVLDGEAVRGTYGNYLTNSQQGWEQYFAGSGKCLPMVREYIITLQQLHERRDLALPGLLQDLQESALCTGTKIDYSNSNLPVGDGYLDELLKDSAWKNALQDEVFHYDASEAVDVLQEVSGKRLYIWTPSAEERKSHPERAVWLCINTDWFNLNCYNNPINDYGRSRGVHEVGAAGASKKSEESAKTEKSEVLLPTKANILQVSQPYVCGFAYETFQRIVPEDAAAADVLVPARDLKLVPDHSWPEFEQKVRAMYKK